MKIGPAHLNPTRPPPPEKVEMRSREREAPEPREAPRSRSIPQGGVGRVVDKTA